MMKNLLYFVKLTTFFVIVLISNCAGRISDKRLCADLQCSVPISMARAVIKYTSDDARILSFRPGDTLTVYSKAAGSRMDLWGAEIKGKRGYVPKNLIQEYKVLKKDPLYEIPTDEAAVQVKKEEVVPNVAQASVPEEQPANEQGPMYVIDGTTLYLPEDSSMQMTTNVETQATTSAPETNKSAEKKSTRQETSVEHTASDASPAETLPEVKPEEIVTERGEDASSTVITPILEPPIENTDSEKPLKVPEKSPEENIKPETTSEEVENEENKSEEVGNVENKSGEVENVENKSGEVENKENKSEDVKNSENTSDETENVENKSEETDTGSVYDYLSDTLTGWMSGDGGENEEEEEEEDDSETIDEEEEENKSNDGLEISSDTGQENITETPIQQESPEMKPSENIQIPDVTSETEIPPKIQEIPVTESSMLPETVLQSEQPPPVEEVKVGDLPNTGNIEPNTIMPPSDINIVEEGKSENESAEQLASNLVDEIDMQGQYPPAAPSSAFSYLSYTGNQNKGENPSVVNTDTVPQEEVKVEQQQQPIEEPTEIVTPPSEEDIEPPVEEITRITTPEELDVSTPSPIFYEPSPTELPNQEATETPQTREDLGAVDETTISDTKDMEENTTTEVKIAGTFEEITTAAPPPVVEEVAPEEESSGGLFASWVYTLFGYGSTAEEEQSDDVDVTEDITTPENIPENISSEPVEESPAASWWSWGNSDTKEESIVPKQTCNAQSGELGCEDIVGSIPSEKQEETVTSIPHHKHQWPTQEATVATMDWDTVASSDKVIVLVITAVTVLIFTLGYYYMEKTKKDDILIAKINALQKELLVASKECLILKDDLDMTKERLNGAETTSFGSNEEVQKVQLELENAQSMNAELEEQVVSLEKELEAATEAGLELNKILSEFLSAQKGSEDLTKSVELLQQQLNKQQATISSMNQALTAKAQEAEEVQSDLLQAEAKILELETELAKQAERLEEVQKQKQNLTEDLEESCVTLANQLQEAAQLREAEVKVLKKQLDASEARLTEVEESLRTRSSELEVLQGSLAKVQTLEGDDSEEGQKKLNALLDVGKAQAELKLITSERDVLKERLQCEEDARQLLEDHVKVICVEVEKLRERHEVAEREKQEAQTKLEVLSSYFKEKETQLQKELGLQEAMCEQKKEDVSVTHVKIKTMQEEIENYKAQNETLKQEIVEQERSLKGQITTLEKKAHENWIAARQAERKLDETKQEAGTLRNRLTMLEKGPVVAQNGEDGKQAQRLDANGELLPTSPLLHIGDSPSMSPHLVGAPQHYMMMPPPPLPTGAYMPPPPPPEYLHSPPPPLPLYPDRRPPPLGRMSSPPPHHFSPPPDHYSSPYRPRSPASDRSLPRYRYSSRSPSPPPYGHPDYAPYPTSARPWEEPRAGFRPLHRDRDREKDQKGSTLSSGHSSESLEKSSRHSGGKS